MGEERQRVSMTGHVHFEYAPPKTWEQFEEMCADLFQTMWRDPSLVRHGRAGQLQNGVDIVARHGSLYPIGIQCKRRARWPISKLTTKEIKNEVEEAKKFKPELKHFYIVTTAQDDAKLQEFVRDLNRQQKQGKSFEVTLLGWSELVRRVTLEPSVASKHFGAVGGVQPEPLLATWFTRGGALDCSDDEFSLRASELELDLHDHPIGRVVIRQHESDELLQEINALDVRKQTDTIRKLRIEMRGRLRKMTHREAEAVRSLLFLFQTQEIQFLLREIWPSLMPSVVRRVVERAMGLRTPDSQIDYAEMRLWPPGGSRPDTLDRITIHLSQEQVKAIMQRSEDHSKRWNKAMSKEVLELPDSVLKLVIPAIVNRLLARIDGGQSIGDLRAKNWLNLASWTLEP